MGQAGWVVLASKPRRTGYFAASRQTWKTRQGGGSLAQISTMGKYVAQLPSQGQEKIPIGDP
jgi:hypothetical protein